VKEQIQELLDKYKVEVLVFDTTITKPDGICTILIKAVFPNGNVGTFTNEFSKATFGIMHLNLCSFILRNN